MMLGSKGFLKLAIVHGVKKLAKLPLASTGI